MTTPQPASQRPVADAQGEAGPADGLFDGDWPVRATDTIERLIDQVRSKTTGPAIVASRWVVYGLVAAVLGLAALVLFVIVVVRGLDIAIPGDVWIVYLILGLVSSIGGVLLWRKRAPGTSA
jgi:hypothetical protein